MLPLERLINLAALLLEAKRPLTFEEIRNLIPAYGQDDNAAKRMFERDKDTLRDAGIPVDLVFTDVWEVEKGYRIDRERYALPEISFTPDEMWALYVAAHAPGGDQAAEAAFRKLSSGAEGNVLAAVAGRTPAPGVDASGPHLGAIAESLAGRRAIAFTYRPLRGAAGVRTVEPYALVFRAGSWYLTGLDRDRGETRSFRLSRIRSDVRQVGDAGDAPAGFDAVRLLEAGPWGLGRPAATARVSFSPKIGWLALSATPGARIVGTRSDGWMLLEVPSGAPEQFVSWVLSFGADARAEEPRAIQDEVVSRLRELAGAAAAEGPGEGGRQRRGAGRR